MSSQRNPPETFRAEAAELLSEIEELVLDVERRPSDKELLNRLFRIIHNIKGAADMFGFGAAAACAHEIESTLDKVRRGLIPADRKIIDEVLQVRDRIIAIIDGSHLSAQAACAREVKNPPPAPAPPPPPVSEPPTEIFTVSLTPDPEIFHSGADPADLLDELRGLGDCAVSAVTDAVPELGGLDPELCFLKWRAILETDAGADAVRDVFIFLGDSEWSVTQDAGERGGGRREKDTGEPRALILDDGGLMRDFRVEAAGHLLSARSGLLILGEQGGSAPDQNLAEKIFRAVHSVKGAAGFLGLSNIIKVSHAMETMLELLRSGAAAPSRARIEALLEGADFLDRLLKDSDVPSDAADAAADRVNALIREISPAARAAMDRKVKIQSGDGAGAGHVMDELSFRSLHKKDEFLYILKYELLSFQRESGMSPGEVVRELTMLGKILDSSLARPSVKLSDPLESAPLRFEVLFSTIIDPSLIAGALRLKEESIERVVEPLLSGEEIPPVAAPAAENSSARPAAAPVPEERPVGEGFQTRGAESVRVASEKLDALVSLAGEMVILQARLSSAAAETGNPKLSAAVEEMERLISDLRDKALTVRMTPIGGLFGRYKRLVRDLSLELGKKIELITSGGDTELDKVMLDSLADPLVHLVRNSIDHGVESPAARAAAGKPSAGVVSLSAEHKGARVIITVSDDGRGIDAESVRAKAVEKGLIAPDAGPSDAELFQFVFMPGFSTAREVTGISGRGVGMDVVKRQIEALRGTVEISSVKGGGTSVSLSLPLTLAIIDGLLVTAGPGKYIIPLSCALESVELRAADRRGGSNFVVVRGRRIPYIRLREIFGVPGEFPGIENVVLVDFDGTQIGLAVDRVIGNHQTVIKSLGRLYRDAGSVSGATIMGDGAIALILDIHGVVKLHNAKDHSR